MLTLLHLSDLHITTADEGSQFDRDVKIREALLDDLGKDGRTNFDAILVTGDIAYHGRVEEFARAKDWLESLRVVTQSAPEDFFVVPGNHDVNQTTVSKDSSLWELHQSIRNISSVEDRTASLGKKLRDPFDFLASLAEYRAFASAYGCPTSSNALAWTHVATGKTLEDGTVLRFHGLNSALLSDEADLKANLLLGDFQFNHFDADPGYVNVVLCHHPHSWLIDGNESNDFFRNRAHVILCGHEHDHRCYKEGGSLRVFAGAIHPNRRETRWEPSYHVLRLSMNSVTRRELNVCVETRIWRDKDKCFSKHVHSDNSDHHEECLILPNWDRSTTAHGCSSIVSSGSTLPATLTMVSPTLTADEFLSAKRRLMVHFFRIGTLQKYEAAISAGVWEESDDAFGGQARWARVFERAEKTGKLKSLWEAVALRDSTLTGQLNPFITGT